MRPRRLPWDCESDRADHPRADEKASRCEQEIAHPNSPHWVVVLAIDVRPRPFSLPRNHPWLLRPFRISKNARCMRGGSERPRRISACVQALDGFEQLLGLRG